MFTIEHASVVATDWFSSFQEKENQSLIASIASLQEEVLPCPQRTREE